MAILLSQMKLEDLREGDWVNLRHDLLDFIYPGLRKSEDKKIIAWFDQRISKSMITEIQARFKEYFALLISPEDPKKPQLFGDLRISHFERHPPFSAGIRLAVLTEGWHTLSSDSPDSPFKHSVFTKDLRSNFDSAFIAHLIGSQVTRAQIRPCPECRRIFLVKMKPRADMKYHCSNRCSRIAANKTYQDKLKGEKERSRRRYVEGQRRKLGPKVKVARRPRKARGV